jgi:uncharacterized protein (TIGR03067 family)
VNSTSRWAAAVLTLVLVPVTNLRGDDAGDLKKMQGTWSYTTRDGGEGLWVFKDDRLSVKLPSRSYMLRLKLDSQAKPHPAVDIRVSEGPEDAQGKTVFGIYKFDGEDTLTICIGGGDNPRPNNFEANEGESYSFKLKRK